MQPPLKSISAAALCALIAHGLPQTLLAADSENWRCRDIVEQGITIRSCQSVATQDAAQNTTQNIAADTTPDTAQHITRDANTVLDAALPAPADNTGRRVTEPSADITSGCAANTADPAYAVTRSGSGNALTQADPNAPIDASALELSLEENIVEYRGDVEITRGPARLRADSASYSRDTQIVELRGNVSADNPAAELQGSRAELNLADNSSFVEDAHYRLRDLGTRGSARSVSIDNERRVSVEQGSYTRCPEDAGHWEVRAGKIRLDPDRGQGSAKNATLRIYDTPVLYVPYAQFPIGDQRQSGLLFPQLADTSAGVDIALPYYFNIAPNIDATLTPRIVQQAGYLTEAELRWLNHYDRWALGGAYIGDDDRNGEARWLLDIEEQGESSSGLSSQIRFTRISDVDYLRDLSASSIAVNRNTHLEQSAQLGWRSGGFSVGAMAQRFQTLDDSLQAALKPYATEPELWLRYQSFAQPGSLQSDVEVRAASYRHETLPDGERGYASLGFSLPLAWQGLNIEPALGAQHIEYDLNDALPGSSEKSPAQTARSASLEFSADWVKWGGRSAGTAAERSVITPRLRYLHRELDSSSSDVSAIPLFDSKWHSSNQLLLFGDSRFAGYDVLEPADQLAAGLTHSRYRNGSLRGEFTLGQLFYFDRRARQGSNLNALGNAALQDNARSSLLADYRWRHGRALQSLASLQWDSENNSWQRGSWQLRYRGEALPGGGSELFNLGYRYWRANPADLLLGRDIEQVDSSMVTAIAPNWQLLARFQYDLTGKRSSETLAGLQYDDCCLQLRLVYRDGLVYSPIDIAGGAGPGSAARAVRDHSIYLQIEFKGLAGVGRGLQNVLEESIFGYRAD